MLTPAWLPGWLRTAINDRSWLTRPVFGWSLFDFANQAFTIVILTTLYQVYFIEEVVPGDGSPGRRAWAVCGIVTQVLLVVLSPLLGAFADFTGIKKRLLFVTFVGSVAFTAALGLVRPGDALLGSVLFVLAYLFYGAGENLLSAFLPELCRHRDMGKVSAFSWTLAYIGALLALAVAVVITLILPGEAGYRLTAVWTALFFLVAGVPLFLWVPERRYHEPMPPGQTLATIGFHRLVETSRQLKRYRDLFRFLALMTFYFAGMQIIYWFAGTITKELFGFTNVKMGLFVMQITVTAIVGAAITGRYQDRIGTRVTILLSLAYWTGVMLLVSAATSEWLFWTVGNLVGLGIGALGTASRAMVGLFSPPQKSAEFFGFYGIAHKVSAMIGLGWITAMEWMFPDRFDIVVGSAAIFFGLGFLGMLFVSEGRGRINALRVTRELRRGAEVIPAPVGPAPWPPPPTVVPMDAGDPPSSSRDTGDRSVAAHGHSPGFTDTDVDAPIPLEPARDDRGRLGDDPATVMTELPAAMDSRSERVIELDNNATTRPAPEVVAAMREALEADWHNPSSVHRPGQRARRRVELARESVCRLLGCAERELVFTSGGTESVNLAIAGSLDAQPGRRLVVTSRLEHSAMRELAETLSERGRAEVQWLEHDRHGCVELDALRALLSQRAAEVAVVSVMWANNETGLVQPIESIGALCREHGVRFHTDAVQWVGKMPLNVGEAPIDLLSFSGHKFHGPKGVGGLYIRRGIRIARQIIGGPQERDRRGGTENVPAIVGLGAAAERASRWLETSERDRLAALRDRLDRGVIAAVEGAVVNGVDADGSGPPRLWNTTNIAFPRLEAEAILLLLSERGVCASAGAACSSGSLDPSPVLLAMGIAPELAHGSIRLSLSRDTTEEEIDRAIEVIGEAIGRLRRSMPRGS